MTEPKRSFDPLEPQNSVLESGDWVRDVIWDSRGISPDLLEDDEVEPIADRHAGEQAKTLPSAQFTLDPYNLSNDRLYEHARATRFRIRQTFGAIEVFHSQPAKDLQMPFVSFTFAQVLLPN